MNKFKSDKFKEYYFNPLEPFQIYVDMDGVLCDFDFQFKTLTKFEYTSDEYVYKYGREDFQNTILEAGIDFWSEMPWKDDGRLLWNYVTKYNPIILSTPFEFASCYEGKESWCSNFLGRKYQVILTKDKAQYAAKNSLLIDDFDTNTIPFEEAGGNAILHTSAIETIKILKEKYQI